LLFRDKYNNIAHTKTTLRFIADITKPIINKIEKLRNGQDLQINFRGSTRYVQIDSEPNTFGKIANFYFSPIRTDANKTVTAREWIDIVLKPAGYGDRLIVEIPSSFPKIDELSISIANRQVWVELRERLIRAITDLKRAQDEYLNYRNDNVADRVRESADAIRKFLKSNKTMLATELMENTSTCSSNISEELFNSLIKILESVYNFGSKSPHAVTRVGPLMEYRPDIEDSEMLIAGLLSVLLYISKKLEKRLQ